MPKKCKPPKKVRQAGKQLATSSSKRVKSKAAKILVKHKINKH